MGLLLALARDPLLRATATAVIRTPVGHEFSRQSMKDALSEVIGDRYSEWEAEFRNRQTKLEGDPRRMSSKRTQPLGAAVQDAIGSVKLLHGKGKEPRKLALHFGPAPPPISPQGTTHDMATRINIQFYSDTPDALLKALLE